MESITTYKGSDYKNSQEIFQRMKIVEAVTIPAPNCFFRKKSNILYPKDDQDLEIQGTFFAKENPGVYQQKKTLCYGQSSHTV